MTFALTGTAGQVSALELAAADNHKGEAVTGKSRSRVYHGIDGNAEGINTRILVVDGGGGPTERRDHVTVLYELAPKKPFWWGYAGGGPGRTAESIIEDVLPDPVAGIPALDELSPAFRGELIMAFLVDFVAHFHDSAQFWLPAQTVIRWIRGYVRDVQTA